MHHLALPGNVILLWPLNLCLMEDSSNLLHLSSETKPEYIRYEYKLRDWFTICSSKYFLILYDTCENCYIFLSNFFSPSIRFHIFSLFTLKLIWIFVLYFDLHGSNIFCRSTLLAFSICMQMYKKWCNKHSKIPQW